jgi:hypothetical protein
MTSKPIRFGPNPDDLPPVPPIDVDKMEIGQAEPLFPEKRKKFCHIGAPACFALELAIRDVAEAFGAYRAEGEYAGIYVVGSALQRPDWRDVDVRFMMSDKAFAELFPAAGQHWEWDARWLLLTTMISERLSRLTGLPIDFQFQPQTHANERHKGLRNAIGVRIKE